MVNQFYLRPENKNISQTTIDFHNSEISQILVQ